MRTQIAKTGYLPAEYIPPTFDSRHPPPLPQVHRGGCYREKFFLFFFYSRLDSCFDSVFQIILFNYFDSIKVRHLILDFIFRNIHRFDSLQFSLDIPYLFFVMFHSHQFRLFQHCIFYALTLRLFISLTLLLVINKHLCLCEFVLCLF